MLKSILISILILASAHASDGSFDKKKEDTYQLIVIGTVSQVRVVPMIENLPATIDDIKKDHIEQSKEDPTRPNLTKRILLYTGILTVEKPIKGQSKKGDKILVTWWQAGGSGKNGETGPVLSCPRVTKHVAAGDRRVIAVTATSCSMPGSVSHIVDGSVTHYEPIPDDYEPNPDGPFDPNDPFATKPPKEKTPKNPKK